MRFLISLALITAFLLTLTPVSAQDDAATALYDELTAVTGVSQIHAFTVYPDEDGTGSIAYVYAEVLPGLDTEDLALDLYIPLYLHARDNFAEPEFIPFYFNAILFYEDTYTNWTWQDGEQAWRMVEIDPPNPDFTQLHDELEYRRTTELDSGNIYAYRVRGFEDYTITVYVGTSNLPHDYETGHIEVTEQKINGIDVQWGYADEITNEEGVVRQEAYRSLSFDFQFMGMYYSGEITNTTGEPAADNLSGILGFFLAAVTQPDFMFPLSDGPRTAPSPVPTATPTLTPTPRPTNTSPPPTAPPTSADVSGCPSLDANCSELTCSQAYACLAAGNRDLDRDRDGIPCESVCGN
jgi:hypothetical protein